MEFILLSSPCSAFSPVTKKRPIQSLKPTVSPNFSSDDDPLVPETNSPEPYFDSIEPVINNLSTFSISSNKKTTTENLIF